MSYERYEVHLCAGTVERPHTDFGTLAEAQAYCIKNRWRYTDADGIQWGLCIAKVVHL